MTDTHKKCLFCRIANGEEANTRILLDQDDIVIFKDIKPAATHHYLIVPKAHTKAAKYLTANEAPLLKKLVTIGKDFLAQQGGDLDDARLGFHWPPFHSIPHLHLHVISPQREMGWIARGIFKPQSYWFKTPEWVIQRLEGTEI